MQNDSVFGNPSSKKKLEEINFRNNLDELYNLIKSNKNAFPNSLPLFDNFYTKFEKDNKELTNKFENIIEYLKNLKLKNNLSQNDMKKIDKDIKELQNQIKQIG